MKKQKKYKFVRSIYTENELKNAISVLSDMQANYNIFDAEEYTKSCACSIAIDAIRSIVCADSSRGEQK